ncbi:MAG TPA: hypothetical protein VD931_22740 [Baekduia sp.]|nr:hypothetical protein [Baekduia sp.]
MERRRRTDRGWTCWLAMRAGELWDFVDKRDIDKHVVSMAVFAGTVTVMRWAMAFATEALAAGTETFEAAAVIAAVLAPYMAMQAAALKWYFETRSA